MDSSKYPIEKPEIHIPEARESPAETPPRTQVPTKSSGAAKVNASDTKEASKARHAKFGNKTNGEQIEFDNIVLAMQEGSLEVSLLNFANGFAGVKQ